MLFLDTYFLVDIADDFIYTWGTLEHVSQVQEESYAGLVIVTQAQLSSNMLTQLSKELTPKE